MTSRHLIKGLKMPGLISEPASTPLTPVEYFENALAWSKEVQSKVKCELDIAYGPDKRQKLDVYPPEPSGATPVPVLMFMHGGYWVVGHKDTLGFMAPPITSAPAVLVTAGYRLAPGVKYPVQVDDCQTQVEVGVREYCQIRRRHGPYIRRRALGGWASGSVVDPANGPSKGLRAIRGRDQGLFPGERRVRRDRRSSR